MLKLRDIRCRNPHWRLTWLCHTLMAISLILLVACNPSVSGTYEGTCLNHTYGGQSRMILYINQSEQYINGELSLHGELGGGGSISGRVDGKTLTFTTKDFIVGTITWTAQVRGKSLIGEYQVETPVWTSALTGASNQKGVWEVARK